MQKLKRCLAVVMACSLLCIPYWHMDAAVQAEDDTKKVVVIGDSISTRAGLAEGELSYVEILENYMHIEVQNFAQESYTTTEVLASLNDTQVQQALAEADIILVTAGIHDIMDPFFEEVHVMMDEFGFTSLSDVFSANMEDYGMTTTQLMTYANKLIKAAKTNKTEATANLEAITENLSQYEDAIIVYQTVYNSIDTIEEYASLSDTRRTAYDTVCNPITTLMNECYNDYLHTLAENENCIIIDTFSAFDNYAYMYTNLSDLDINPNQAGHTCIASAILEAFELEIPEEVYVTLEANDNTVYTFDEAIQYVSITDASVAFSQKISDTSLRMTGLKAGTTTVTVVLESGHTMIYYITVNAPETTTTEATTTMTETTTTTEVTTTTTQTTTTTTETTLEFGDLNNDGEVDAKDASLVLIAAANIGAGNDSGLTEAQRKATCTDETENIDAKFASNILIYAARAGAGIAGTESFAVFYTTQ